MQVHCTDTMSYIDPNAEWRRLAEFYRTLPDLELLELAEDADSLTDVARDAVQVELKSRNLSLPIPAEVEPGDANDPTLIFASPRSDEFDVPDAEARLVNEESTEWIVIQSYQNAAEAAEARAILEEARVDCRLTDGSVVQGRGLEQQRFTQMELQVRECDIDKALDLLSFDMAAEETEEEDSDEADQDATR